MTDPNRPRVHAIALDWQDWATAQSIPLSLVENMSIETIRDEIYNWITTTARASILSDKFADEKHQVAVWVPRTPWQMFKEQHARSRWLGWYVRRHPPQRTVRFSEVRIQRMHWYPEARLPREQFGRAYLHEIVTARPVPEGES